MSSRDRAGRKRNNDLDLSALSASSPASDPIRDGIVDRYLREHYPDAFREIKNSARGLRTQAFHESSIYHLPHDLSSGDKVLTFDDYAAEAPQSQCRVHYRDDREQNRYNRFEWLHLHFPSHGDIEICEIVHVYLVDKLYTTFYLALLDGLSTAEIGARVNSTARTVNNRLAEAKEEILKRPAPVETDDTEDMVDLMTNVPLPQSSYLSHLLRHRRPPSSGSTRICECGHCLTYENMDHKKKRQYRCPHCTRVWNEAELPMLS